MKKIKLLLVSLLITALNTFAQGEQGVLPPEGSKFSTYTEWKKVDVEFEGGEKASYEYRIALVKKKGLGCHYDLQIKNTSGIKLKFKVNTHYYDKLVKGNFGDKFEEKTKAGSIRSFLVITQGCKADKGQKDQDDYARCMACGLSYDIHVYKD